MVRAILILVVGIAIGYGYGFRDAQTHDTNIAQRLIERVGGATRDRVGTDVDAKMRAVEK